MAYGDGEALNIDRIYRVSAVGNPLVLTRAAEDLSEGVTQSNAAQGEPLVGDISIASAAGALQPGANGPERYRVRIERIR
jgi:hypothetical protein